MEPQLTRQTLDEVFRTFGIHTIMSAEEYEDGVGQLESELRRLGLDADAAQLQRLPFSRAVLEAVPYLGFTPDVIHANDWQTALIPLLAQTLFGALGACFTFRFFPHYFVQVLPLLALCVGMLAGESFRRVTLRERPAWVSFATMLAAAMLLLGVAHSALHRNVRFRRETDRWYQPPGQDPIVRYVTERTEPGDRIFVWGFRAETYLSARRLPGSRYVYTVYPAGVVPWFPSTRDEEESRQVPGSRQLMLEDLERERPELVIDAGRSMSGRYMYNYPELRQYLDRNYCFMRYVDGEPVYRRRQNGDCPPADY